MGWAAATTTTGQHDARETEALPGAPRSGAAPFTWKADGHGDMGNLPTTFNLPASRRRAGSLMPSVDLPAVQH